MDALVNASAEEIADVRGIGDIIAQAVVSYFDEPSAKALVEKLARTGSRSRSRKRAAADGALRGHDGRHHRNAADAQPSRRQPRSSRKRAAG